MSEMLLKMTLTLTDGASGPLAKFIQSIRSIDTAVTKLNPKLTQLNDNLALVTQTGATAATSFGAFEMALKAIAASLAGVEQRVAGVTARFEGLTASTLAATNSMTAMQPALNSAGQGVTNVTNQVTGLSSALKGMAQLWGAMEVKKGLGASVSAAAEYQVSKTELTAFNMKPEDEAYALQKSRDLSDASSYLDYGAALDARISILAGLAKFNAEGNKLADEVTGTFTTVANNLMRLNMGGTMKDNVRNITAVMEARQITGDTPAMLRTAELLQKVIVGSGMKLNVQDMETVFRQMKYGSSQNISDEGILKLMAYVEQLKVSGGGSGGARGVSMAGTAITSMERWGLGGKMNKQSADMLAEMGLLDRQKIRGGTSTTETNVGAGALINAGLMSTDPIGWLQKYGPVFLKYTKDHRSQFYGKNDPENEKAQEAALQKLAVVLTSAQGGQNVGDMIVRALTPRSSERILNTSAAMSNVLDSKPLSEKLDDAYKQKLADFDKSLTNLGITVGTAVLPALTHLMDTLAKIVSNIASFAGNHEFLTQLGFWTVAITGVVLALKGLGNMFGLVFGSLFARAPVLAGTGAAVTTLASSLKGAGLAIESFLLFSGKIPSAATLIGLAITGLSKAVLRAVPIIGGFMLAWDLTEIVANFKIGGVKIIDYIFSWIERLGVFLGLLDEARAKAARVAAGIDTAEKPVVPMLGKPSKFVMPLSLQGGLPHAPKDIPEDPINPTKKEANIKHATKMEQYHEELASQKANQVFTEKTDELAFEKAFWDKKIALEGVNEKTMLAMKRRASDLAHQIATIAYKKEEEQWKENTLAKIDLQEQADIEAIDEQIRLSEHELALGKKTHLEQLHELRDFEAKKLAIKLKAEEKRGFANEIVGDTKASGKSTLKQGALTNDGEKERAKLALKAALEVQKTWISAFSGIESAIANTFMKLKTHAFSWKMGMRDIAQGVKDYMLKSSAEWLAKYMTDKLRALAFDMAMAAAKKSVIVTSILTELGLMEAASDTTKTVKITEAGVVVSAAAAKTAAEGASAVAPIPVAGPSLAVAAFAMLLGMVMGAKGLIPSFDVGTDYVPHDMLAMIHKGEKIVPAAYNVKANQQAGGRQTINNNNFVMGAATDYRTQNQIATEVAHKTRRAAERNL